MITPSVTSSKRIYRCGTCGVPGHRANRCQVSQSLVSSLLNPEDEELSDAHPKDVKEDPIEGPVAKKEVEKVICLFCDDEMPVKPSKKLLAMQKDLLTIPDVKVSHCPSRFCYRKQPLIRRLPSLISVAPNRGLLSTT